MYDIQKIIQNRLLLMKLTIVFPFEAIWEKGKIFQSCRLLESCKDLFKKSSVKHECHDKCVA